MIKKLFIFLILFFFNSQLIGKQFCVYKDEITLVTNVKIKKIKIVNEYSEDLKNRQRKCVSNFNIKTNKWKSLKGEYIYGTNIAEDEACNLARKLAIQNYIENNFENLVTNVQTLNCEEIEKNREVIAFDVDNVDLNKKEKKENILTKLWKSMNKQQKDDFLTNLIIYAFGF